MRLSSLFIILLMTVFMGLSSIYRKASYGSSPASAVATGAGPASAATTVESEASSGAGSTGSGNATDRPADGSTSAASVAGASGVDGPGGGVEVGIREKLGSAVPLDLTFTGEDGEKITLRDLFDKPVVLALAYYRCTNVCTELLSAAAAVIPATESVPGVDYTLVTVSIDEMDTPADARAKKNDYLAAASTAQRSIGPGAWRFLTGTRDEILRLSDSLGFMFYRVEGGFNHPASLVVASREGVVTRYLYGTDYKPFDIDMALSEASSGRTGPTIPKALRLCFTFDPEKKTYVFDVLKVTGAAVLFVTGLFAVLLKRSGNKRARQQGPRP